MTEKKAKKKEVVPGVLIAVLSISSWTNAGRDGEAEGELAKIHKCKEQRLRVTKELLSKDNCPELAAVKSVERRAREVWREMTLPWMDRGGGRMLAAEAHTSFLAKMREIERELRKTWEDLSKVFDQKVAAEKKDLGSMFKAQDYPSGKELLELFSFDVDIMPLAKVKDIRLSVRSNELKQIKKDYEKMVERKLDTAIKAPWIRIHKVVSHMIERLDAKDISSNSRLYESVVFNIKDLAELLPTLNISQDPELDKMAIDLKRKLTKYNVDILKDSPLLRSEIRKNGQKILIKAEDKIHDRNDSLPDVEEEDAGEAEGSQEGVQADSGGDGSAEESGSVQDEEGSGRATSGIGQNNDSEPGAEGDTVEGESGGDRGGSAFSMS